MISAVYLRPTTSPTIFTYDIRPYGPLVIVGYSNIKHYRAFL